MTSFRTCHWDALDPFLAGPAPAPAHTRGRPFEVPAEASPPFRFGRLRSAEAWPAALSPVDRLAAVPLASSAAKVGGVRPVATLELSTGESVPVCFEPGAAGVRWNVDPERWIARLLAEAYVADWKRPMVSRVPLLNYSRIPHAWKAILQRLQDPTAASSAPVAFPRLPVDDLVETVRELAFALAFDARPEPGAVWPGAHTAAVTLTHDVDTSWILDPPQAAMLTEIVETEASLGFRGAWYVVGDQLSPADHAAALRTIRDAGSEVAAHGWNHDAKLEYLSASGQERRMERIRARFAGLDLEGLRTPWYCRSEGLFEVIARHFTYDSSVPNASSYFSAETHSGCCTVLPYRPREGLLELPLTLPPDTSLDPVRGYEDLARAADAIVARGGLVVITLHPQPHQSGNREALERYFAFLRNLRAAHGERLWSATPGGIARHYASALAGAS